MYPVIATAKSKCPNVILGVTQNASQETQVERVPNHPVEKRRRELVLGRLSPPQPGEHLTQRRTDRNDR